MMLGLYRRIVKVRSNNACKFVTLIVFNVTILVLFFSIRDRGSDVIHIPERNDVANSVASKLTNRYSVSASKRNIGDEFVDLFDIQLSRSFFPVWFWNSSMASLSRSLSFIRLRGRGQNEPIIKDKQGHGDSNPPNWIKFKHHMRRYSLYDPDDPTVEAVMRDMRTLSIVDLDDDRQIIGGTQLKMKITFEDGGKAMLKPKRVKTVNSDRHFAEIAAFHLDRIMGFYRIPPTVGRSINIATELVPLFSKTYKKTVFTSKKGSTCFYGKCPRRCTPDIAVCGKPNNTDVSLQYIVPTANNSEGSFDEILSPWKIVWRGVRNSDWISEEFLCNKTRSTIRTGDWFLLDVLDAMFFDVIIDNVDRHHFGMYTDFGKDSNIILLDQGKGFKNESEVDETLELFLYERGGCCLIRKTTFLLFFKHLIGPERLSDLMRDSMAGDPTNPVLTERHLEGLDRRVKKLMFYIGQCLRHYKIEDVIIDDTRYSTATN